MKTENQKVKVIRNERWKEKLNESRMVSVVFFFKKKTAYEIYQCDWSSDVCSSDILFY